MVVAHCAQSSCSEVFGFQRQSKRCTDNVLVNILTSNWGSITKKGWAEPLRASAVVEILEAEFISRIRS